MKILKVKIKREQKPNVTHYEYPEEYDAKKIKVMCYESNLPEKLQEIIDRGNNDEYLIGCVKDEDAAQFLASSDIEELTEAQALEHGNQWTKQIEKIIDQRKVISILAKIARKEELTPDDEKVLDPNDSTLGVNMSKSFEEVLNDYKTKL